MKSDFENRLEAFNRNSLEISKHISTFRDHTDFIKNLMNKHVSSLDRSLTENLSTNSAKDRSDYELSHIWDVSNPMQSPISFWELTSDTPSPAIGFTGPTFGQRRVMEVLSWYDNVAVTSGEKVGVTHLSVIYASWFLLHYDNSRAIITGSPETRNDWYNCFFNYHRGTLLPGNVGQVLFLVEIIRGSYFQSAASASWLSLSSFKSFSSARLSLGKLRKPLTLRRRGSMSKSAVANHRER